MAQLVKKTPLDQTQWPNATIDEKQSLKVGAAIGSQDFDRVKALGTVVDAFVVDVAHFHSRSCFSGARRILKESPVDVIVGNIGTFSAAEDVLSQLDGVAGIRCGFGRETPSKISVYARDRPPTLFAIASAADAARTLGINIPIVADGDIQKTRDMTLALAAGAWTVMLESVLATTKESLAPTEVHPRKPSKVIVKRTVQGIVEEITTMIQVACAYIGAGSIPEMWESARFGRLSRRKE